MLWFLMGYTSKLAGTETGIVDPVSTFSRFFGEPFMPRNPDVYASMLGEKMKQHGSEVYLINTGWSGGPFGIGSRMDIDITRTIVRCALAGELCHAEYDRKPALPHPGAHHLPRRPLRDPQPAQHLDGQGGVRRARSAIGCRVQHRL